MLAAIGRERESIYLASLSPFRSPTGRIDPRTAEACARLARLHIGLAAPKALLLLGDDCSTALLGRPVSAARGVWHEIETNRGPIRTLVTIRPDKLLAQPALKKLAWQDLQMLMEGYKT
jgi:DNA polymerase